jgi:hypothetical protein
MQTFYKFTKHAESEVTRTDFHLNENYSRVMIVDVSLLTHI